VAHQGLLAGAVPPEHAPHLGQADVGLVDDEQPLVREVLEQGRGRFPGGPPAEVAAVVLDAVAAPRLFDHLEVEEGALLEALRLEQAVAAAQIVEALGQLGADLGDRPQHLLLGGDVEAGGEHHHLVELVQALAPQGIDEAQALDLVPEELDAEGPLFFVGGEHLHHVAAHPEGPPVEVRVVAVVEDLDEARDDLPAIDALAPVQAQEHAVVGFAGADAVDAADAGDHDDVGTGQQGEGGGVPQLVQPLVDEAVLLDVGVRGRDVGFGLVVVEVADEVLDRVVGEQALELAVELGGERLVVAEHQGRAAVVGDAVGDREGLAGAGGAEQDLVGEAGVEPLAELGDGGGLIAAGLEGHLEAEAAHRADLTDPRRAVHPFRHPGRARPRLRAR
jgi:hypothetical protein